VPLEVAAHETARLSEAGPYAVEDQPEGEMGAFGECEEEPTRPGRSTSGLSATPVSATTDVLGAVFLLTFPCGFTPRPSQDPRPLRPFAAGRVRHRRCPGWRHRAGHRQPDPPPVAHHAPPLHPPGHPLRGERRRDAGAVTGAKGATTASTTATHVYASSGDGESRFAQRRDRGPHRLAGPLKPGRGSP
jgi:hypothetical protein